jgi:arginase
VFDWFWSLVERVQFSINLLLTSATSLENLQPNKNVFLFPPKPRTERPSGGSGWPIVRMGLQNMDIRVMVVPYDSGVYGARMGRGPKQLFESGLKSSLTRLGHKVTVEEIKVSGSHTAEIATAFELCRLVANRVQEWLKADNFPILLSGNCNTAIGAIAGCGCQTTGVAWFDAHGESTTPETTQSGFLDGMGISVLTGQCWRKLAAKIPNFSPVLGQNILLIGARDVEPDEAELLTRVGVHRVTDLDELRSKTMSLSNHVSGVYVHLDLDVLDPKDAIANQWPTAGGFSVETLRRAIEHIRKQVPIKGFGIASYDPDCDRDHKALQAACTAAESILGNGRK